MSTDPFAPTGVDTDPYPGTTVLAGALAAFFFPVVTLIAALVLMGGEANPTKKGQLRTLAWASAAWIGVQVLFFLVFVAAVAGGSGGSGDIIIGP